MTYIFYIDGTLADNAVRRKHLLKEKPDWSSYNKEMAFDKPNEPVVYICKLLKAEHRIILVTGREEKFSEITELWLKVNHINFDRIFYRPTGDFRPDNEIKSEIYEDKIKPFNVIHGVFDDRQSVVDMWRQKGLTCFQVDKGNF